MAVLGEGLIFHSCVLQYTARVCYVCLVRAQNRDLFLASAERSRCMFLDCSDTR